ncbi:Uncharacterized protein GBIM_11356 [Gryllus bimaculatus]|nr:Uncharacterized protein GBIM_11356 [Gryllus bimaculatus]
MKFTQAGADVHARDYIGYNPLHLAARGYWENHVSSQLPDKSDWDAPTDHLGCIRALVRHGASVDARDDEDQTPLMVAAENAFSQGIKLLLELGADLSLCTSAGETVLHFACRSADLETMGCVFETGAFDVQCRSGDGSTPLHVSASHWRTAECVEALRESRQRQCRQNQRQLAEDQQTEGRHPEGCQPTNRVPTEGRQPEGQQPEGQQPEDQQPEGQQPRAGNPRDRQPESRQPAAAAVAALPSGAAAAALAAALFGASANGHVGCVELLLARGADATAAAGPERSTPLHAAAAYARTSDQERAPGDYVATIVELGRRGALLDALDEARRSPLHLAARKGRVDRLLRQGLDVNARSFTSRRPLHFAVQQAPLPMVVLLLEHGADPRARDGDGHEPLHRAAAAGYDDAVRLLLRHGAQARSQTYVGLTATHFAAASRSVACLSVLLRNGASATAADQMRNTPLHIAAEEGDVHMVRALLVAGASRTARDANGARPVDLAATAPVRRELQRWALAG